MSTRTVLLLIILLSLSLNIIGITWGLPDRWNVDEAVASALKMAYSKQIMPENDLTHPTFYHFFLIVFLGLYLLVLKVTGYPLYAAASSAAVSWIKFANTDPFLASSLYIVARILSGILGAAMVFVIYLIAKKIYNKRVGLFSALILALSAGFIADNHYAKSSALVNFLSVLTVYFCIKAVYNSKFKKDFFVASFLGGLALATKFNGGILILPLITAYVYFYTANYPYSCNSALDCAKYIKNLISSKIAICSLGFYFLGFFIGFPAIFLHAARYIPGLNLYKENYLIGHLSVGSRIFDLLKAVFGYIYMITNIYGVSLSLMIFAGLFMALKNKNRGKVIILSLAVPYFFIMASIQMLKLPNPKYIILIISFLSISGGLFTNWLIRTRKIPKVLTYLFLSFVLIFSFKHLVSTEMIFLKDDIRYSATNWIESNVPQGATIEIFSELDWNFSSRLLKKYNVLFFGTDSKNEGEANRFKAWLDKEKVKEYFRSLNDSGPKSDYLILSSVDFVDDIFKNIREKERTFFLNNLLKGKWGYKLVKKISYDNRNIFSHIIDYTPTYILILKSTSNCNTPH